jgi:hypothetical protein
VCLHQEIGIARIEEIDAPSESDERTNHGCVLLAVASLSSQLTPTRRPSSLGRSPTTRVPLARLTPTRRASSARFATSPGLEHPPPLANALERQFQHLPLTITPGRPATC